MYEILGELSVFFVLFVLPGVAKADVSCWPINQTLKGIKIKKGKRNERKREKEKGTGKNERELKK